MGSDEKSLEIFTLSKMLANGKIPPVRITRSVTLNPTASVSQLEDVLKNWQEIREKELEAAGPSPTDIVARQVRFASRMVTRQQKLLNDPTRAPSRKLLETIAKVAEADEKKKRQKIREISITGSSSSAGPSQLPSSPKCLEANSAEQSTPVASSRIKLTMKIPKNKPKRPSKSSAGSLRRSPVNSENKKIADSAKFPVDNVVIKQEEDFIFPSDFNTEKFDYANASFSDSLNLNEDSMDSDGDYTSSRRPGPSHSVVRLGSETPTSFLPSLTMRNGCLCSKKFCNTVSFTPGNREVAAEFQLQILKNFFAIRELKLLKRKTDDVSNLDSIPSTSNDTSAIEQPEKALPLAETSEILPGEDKNELPTTNLSDVGDVASHVTDKIPEKSLPESTSESFLVKNVVGECNFSASMTDSEISETGSSAPQFAEVRPISPSVIEHVDEDAMKSTAEFEIPKLVRSQNSEIYLQKSKFDLMLEKLMSATATQEDLANLAAIDWVGLLENTSEKGEGLFDADSETEDEEPSENVTETSEETDGFLENLFQKTDEVIRQQSQQQAEETTNLPASVKQIRRKKTLEDAAEDAAFVDQLLQMADELPSDSESSSDQSDDNEHTRSLSRDYYSNFDNDFGQCLSGTEESEIGYSDEEDEEDYEEVRKWIEDTLAFQSDEESAVARKIKISRRSLSSSNSSQTEDEEDSEVDSSTGDSAIVRDSVEKTAFVKNGCKFNDADLDARLAELFPDDPKQSESSDSESYDDEPADSNQPSTSAGLSRKKKRRKTKKRKRFSSLDSGLSSRSLDRVVEKKVKINFSANKRDRGSDSDSVRSPRKKRIKQEFDSNSDEELCQVEEKDQKVYDVITISDSADAIGSSSESDESGKLFDLSKLNAAEAKKRKNSPKNIAKNGKVRRGYKIMSDRELSMASRRAVKEESDRKNRVEDLPEYEDGLLDQGVTELETIVEVRVHEDLWKELRPHQREGVRFLYRNVVETYEHIQIDNAEYTGCILAHSMGLGKTLQVIAFLQAVFSCDELNVKTCLVLCPASVVLNWNNECKHWMKMIPKDFRFKAFVVKSGSIHENISIMRNWKERGGVLIMSYSLYLSYCRTASGETRLKLSRSLSEIVLECLRDSGPDFLVCDEAHTLKNAKGKQYQCVASIATRARIALTGTPLQNNLDEYYTMVNFVKESLLGTHKEFENRFKKPINRGSESEKSTQRDVRLMKERSHILRETLSGCLLLRGSSVLADSLPPKLEYQITLRPQPMQIALYKALVKYLDARKGDEEPSIGRSEGKNDMLSCHKTMQLITFHPRCLQHRKDQEKEKVNKAFRRRREAELGEDSDDDEDVEDLGDPSVWFENLIPTTSELDWRLGTKTIIVREIILQALAAGDKLLIFADRIPVLAVAEELLQSIHKEKLTTPDGRPICFKAGVNYLKLDGQTKMDTRDERIQKFNKDPECTVFLLSIRAAGMGINLVGANRVILVEPTWNPTTDKQALFRTYRYGQTKPVYVYRLTTFGTLEQRVGELQLRKDLLVNRVLEEKHGRRREAAPESFLHFQESFFDPTRPFIPKDPPKDPLIGNLLQTHPELIHSTANYDSLLEATEPALSHEESVQAWVEYNLEQAEDDQWRGGDPFRNLPLSPDQLAKELNKKDGCSFTVEPADVQSLMAFVSAICRKMPRGSKKNLHAILQRLKQDVGKVRNVLQAVRQQRERAAEAQQAVLYQRAREQMQFLQARKMAAAAQQVVTPSHIVPSMRGSEFANGMSAGALQQRHGLNDGDIPRGMPTNPQWHTPGQYVAPPLNHARPSRPIVIYPDMRHRQIFLPDPRMPLSRIVAPPVVDLGYRMPHYTIPSRMVAPSVNNFHSLMPRYTTPSQMVTPPVIDLDPRMPRYSATSGIVAPPFIDLEDHVAAMQRDQERIETDAREAEEAVQRLLEQ